MSLDMYNRMPPIWEIQVDTTYQYYRNTVAITTIANLLSHFCATHALSNKYSNKYRERGSVGWVKIKLVTVTQAQNVTSRKNVMYTAHKI